MANVITESGPINGFEQQGVQTFLGVPYAAAPIGDLRFMPAAADSPFRYATLCNPLPQSLAPTTLPARAGRARNTG